MSYQPLSKGAHVRVVAPSSSGLSIGENNLRETAALFEKRTGLQVTFAKHVFTAVRLGSASVTNRLADLHEAFKDSSVDAIITVTGGFNANELLDGIDYQLIKKHPKPLIGYSDITALLNAIYQHTGVVTYHGPHLSSFGMKDYFSQTNKYFQKALFSKEPYAFTPSTFYTDDKWWEDQLTRDKKVASGWQVINPGVATGRVLGGNLSTFALLQGTTHFPDLQDTILFLEEDYLVDAQLFNRLVQSLAQQPGFSGVQAIVIGRFQDASQVTHTHLQEMFLTTPFKDLPVLAGVDFGHTNPNFTFPIGAQARVQATTTPSIRIERF